jgi:hypothetical protein
MKENPLRALLAEAKSAIFNCETKGKNSSRRFTINFSHFDLVPSITAVESYLNVRLEGLREMLKNDLLGKRPAPKIVQITRSNTGILETSKEEDVVLPYAHSVTRSS